MGFPDSAFALLIGIGNYQDKRINPLPSTINDVRELARVLTDPALCGYLHQNVTVLADEVATATKIRSELKKIARVVTSDSTVLVHFSGHGGSFERRGKSKTYLCPWDADADQLDGTSVSGEEFSDLLSSIKARKVLITLDTCHAGGSATLRETVIASWSEGLEDSYLKTLAQGSGRVVMASCKADQFSYNTANETYGLFTWHLLEGLKGAASVYKDGFVRVLDLYYYVSLQVKGDQPRQEPILQAKDLDDNFAIALATASETTTTMAPEISTIREKVVMDPAAGALALSVYLSSNSDWSSTRLRVDEQRARIKEDEDNIELFGPDPATVIDKRRAIFYLLKVCLQLEDEIAGANT
jgi:hypothetical protein